MKKTIKSIGVLLACCFVLTSAAQKTIDTIATKAGGYDIPIRIKLPKKTTGKAQYISLCMAVDGMAVLQRMFHQQDCITMLII